MAIVLNLRGLADGEIADLLRAKAETLGDHTTEFPTPSPTIAALQAAATAIDASLAVAQAKAQEAEGATALKDVKVEEGRQALRDLARYTEELKLPAETVEILFDLKKAPTPTTSIGTVQSLNATFGDAAGEIDLTWDPVAKSRGYQAQWRLANDPAAVWTLGKSPTASKTTLTGLPSGQRVEIRVRAIGPKELEGGWSNVMEHLVP